MASKHENLPARKKTRKTPTSAAPVTHATWVQLREISWVHYGKSCTIVTTIRLGRRIYDNLRKAIEYIVAIHIPIAGLALLPLLLGLPLMLTPIHIAFLEKIIDPACSMVFEAETEEAEFMRRAHLLLIGDSTFQNRTAASYWPDRRAE